jgi:hypothetical protein
MDLTLTDEQREIRDWGAHLHQERAVAARA